MATTVLDRPSVKTKTKSFPETHASPEESFLVDLRTTVAVPKDGSVTIIENPSVNGMIGFLLAHGFRKSPDRVELYDVQQYRVNVDDDVRHQRLDHKEKYKKAYIREASYLDRFGVNVVAGDGMIAWDDTVLRGDPTILPQPSVLPYEVNFIPLEGSKGLLPSVTQIMQLLENTETFTEGLCMVYNVVSRSRTFSFNGSRFIVDRDYASFRHNTYLKELR
ncbi:MAG: hypothetical protein V1836_00115 [Candidatus Aenigmatarchaeota archaeon]